MTTMFAVQLFTTVLAFLAIGVQTTPLYLRDVIAPTITSPTAGSVWPVGSIQTVSWDTSNFPPDNQITNPNGQIILGFNSSNSLNLDFAHPLAKNFKLRDGSVTITVPDVPPKDNYLVVLMGDSGNTSPQFAITSISAAVSSAPSSGSSSLDGPVSSSSITGSVTTQDSLSSTTSTTADSTTSPLPTSTTPSSSSSKASSTSGSAAASSSTPTSGARSLHAPRFLSFKALALCMASLAMFTMV